MTYREMCELIAKYWEEVFGKVIDPDHIFQYSVFQYPEDELFMVDKWYAEAKAYFKWKEGKEDEQDVSYQKDYKVTSPYPEGFL